MKMKVKGELRKIKFNVLVKEGSYGNDVKELQIFLGIVADGQFGSQTKKAVIKWQKKNKLKPDGIVGSLTWKAMRIATTDFSENQHNFFGGIKIHTHYLPEDEYLKGPITPHWIFLHHTAGWENPYKTIDLWDSDKRGTIATEFVIGGQSVKDTIKKYDGTVVQAFPPDNYAWHLGKNGNQTMHVNSIGIELCNFGYVVNGRTWAGTRVSTNQIVKLKKPFRGYQYWHKYSDEQINSLKLLLKWIGEREDIDIRCGLPELIKKNGVDAFEWNSDAYYGKVHGVWSHTSIRKDKWDIFPQEEMMDMLISL